MKGVADFCRGKRWQNQIAAKEDAIMIVAPEWAIKKKKDNVAKKGGRNYLKSYFRNK